MGKTIHERDAKVTAFKPAPLSPVACGIDPSCLQNSLKSRRARGSAGVPARDIRITYAFACTIRSRRVCMYNIGALRKSCLPISAYSSDDIRHSGIRIQDRSEHGFAVSPSRSRASTTGLAWTCTVLDYILRDYNYEYCKAEPCGTVLPARLQPAGYREVRYPVSRFGVAEFDGLGNQFASERAFWKAHSAVHHCPRQSAAPRRCLPEPSAIQPSGWWRLHRSWCG